VQHWLRTLGYPVNADAVLDQRTRAALVRFQRSHRLPASGYPDGGTLISLALSAAARLAATASASSSGSPGSAPGTASSGASPSSSATASSSLTGSASSTVSASGSDSPSGSGGSSASSSPSGSSSSNTPALAGCAVADLRATVGSTNSVAGNTFTTVLLAKVGTRPCTMTGLPRLALANPQGTGIGGSSAAGGQLPALPARTVTLASTVPASFTFQATTVPSGDSGTDCLVAGGLLITPPGGAGTVFLAFPVTACLRGQLYVTPIITGTSGGSP
jgi:hypothetical protein